MASQELGPSERDFRIYVAHRLEGWSVRRCAKKFGVHFGHISRICKAVQPWAVRQILAEAPDRLTLKLEQHARYERIWQEANRGWRLSLKDAQKEVLKQGGKFGDSLEQVREGQPGDSQFLARMQAAVEGICRLWGLDEPKPGDGKQGGVNVNVNGETRIVVIEDANWYGNRAHELEAARAAEASIGSAPLGGEIQGSGLRPPVGQNGAGSNGSH